MDVGVFVRMRAASRVSIKALVEGDPYIIVSAVEYLDEKQGEVVVAPSLAEELYKVHSDIVELTTKLDKSPLSTNDLDVEWGHEKTDTSQCFRTSLASQLRLHQSRLAEGKFLEGATENDAFGTALPTTPPPSSDTPAAGDAGDLVQPTSPPDESYMWKTTSAQMEEMQLLSFVALAGLEPEVRLWALDQKKHQGAAGEGHRHADGAQEYTCGQDCPVQSQLRLKQKQMGARQWI